MNMFFLCLSKTSAAVALLWIATLLLRRRSAALRHSLWMCGLASFALIPALVPLARRAPAVPMPAAVDRMLVAASAAKQVAPAPPVHRNVSLLPIVWLGGTLLVCARRARAAFRMRKIAQRSQPSAYGNDVRLSADIRAPLTWGLAAPVILLPSIAPEWPADRLRAILEHEREHIRRRDPLSHWFGEAVCAAWWFHPFAWLARSRATHERECACDDAVLRSGVRSSDYATELLNLISNLSQKGEPLMAISVLSNFERRVGRIVQPGIDRRPVTRAARTAVVCASFAVLLPLAMLRGQSTAGTGDLAGTVYDPSGGRVVNATINAAGSAGNREITRSNSTGDWSFSGIPAGDYTVEVLAPGFKIGTQNVTVAAGQRQTVRNHLEIGSVRQTIHVVASGQPRTPAVQPETATQRVRIGGMVQPTNLIRQIKPAYPPAARAQGIEGTVLIQAVIGKDGSILSAKVANTLIDPDLAAAALAAVKQWEYQPTLLNGEPVEVMTTVSIDFQLQ